MSGRAGRADLAVCSRHSLTLRQLRRPLGRLGSAPRGTDAAEASRARRMPNISPAGRALPGNRGATHDATRPARFCLVALFGVRVLLEKRGVALSATPLRSWC